MTGTERLIVALRYPDTGWGPAPGCARHQSGCCLDRGGSWIDVTPPWIGGTGGPSVKIVW